MIGDPVDPSAPARIVVEQRVEWPDTDAAGHHHHAVVMRWVEAAEAALMARLGLSELFGRIPRVNYRVDYTTRLWFGQRVEVDLGVARIGRSSLTYRFEVRSGDTTAARGEMTIVHTGTNATGAQQWPEAFRAVLAGTGQ